MKISGIVLNSKSHKPVALAKIRIRIQEKEIGAPFFTDEHGKFEFKTDDDHIGQTLSYTIEKDGFEEKIFSTVIDKTEIQKKFLLKENEILKDKWASLKGFVYGIFLFFILIALTVAFQPLATYKILNYTDSVELNDVILVNISIERREGWNWIPFGELDWELRPGEDWIKINKSKGNEPDIVQVSIFTPDYMFGPGRNYTANIYLDNKNLDILNILNYTDNVIKIGFNSLDNKKHPRLDIVVDPKRYIFDDREFNTKKFELSIRNKGSGSPWWSLRNDKSWIELWNYDELYDPNMRRYDDGEVYFKINFSDRDKKELDEGKIKEGHIVLGYNNDGKEKIYVFVCKTNTNSYQMDTKIESWYLPDYYNKTVEPEKPDINCK